MANRPEVLSTKNTSPETPMQFAACRNVGRPILAAAAFQAAGPAGKRVRGQDCPPDISPKAVSIAGSYTRRPHHQPAPLAS